jgi:hypothetical protein
MSMICCQCEILIFITVDIQTHCQQNKKIKQADTILPQVYGTTLIKIERLVVTRIRFL